MPVKNGPKDPAAAKGAAGVKNVDPADAFEGETMAKKAVRTQKKKVNLK